MLKAVETCKCEYGCGKQADNSYEPDLNKIVS